MIVIGDASRNPMPWFAYSLAYLAGLAVAAFLLALPRWLYVSGLSFEDKLAFIIYGVLAPLAGIVVFRLVFGRLTGRWCGPTFWLIAPLAVYAVTVMTFLAVYGGYIPLSEGRWLQAGLPFVMALRLTR